MAEVTVIIPVYNEEKVIQKTIESTISFLNKKKYDSCILIANDGSTDKTSEIINELSKKNKNLRCVNLNKNKGRGAVLNKALSVCDTPHAIYFDADLQINLDLFDDVLQGLKNGADICIGSKHHVQSVIEYPPIRLLASKCYRLLCKLVLNSEITDYQCGFKGFDVKKIKPILTLIKQDGWAWDTEVLVKSLWAGFKIKEFPVKVQNVYSRDSRVRLLRDIFRMGNSLIQIRKDKYSFIEAIKKIQK